MNPDVTIEKKLQERFSALPKTVQEAIKSSDVEKNLHELSQTHKLHVDQWQKLENEVMFALLGLSQPEQLEENIKKEVGISDDVAHTLTEDIAETIFQPIRAELERELEEVEARGKRQEAMGDIGNGQEALGNRQQKAEIPTIEPAAAISSEATSEKKLLVAPSTPPPPPPIQKAARPPLSSSSYAPRIPSHERRDAENDPYREPIA